MGGRSDCRVQRAFETNQDNSYEKCNSSSDSDLHDNVTFVSEQNMQDCELSLSEATSKSEDHVWLCWECKAENPDSRDTCKCCTRPKKRPPNLDPIVHIKELLPLQGMYKTENKSNVERLSEKFGEFQGVLGDGNCFYRAVFVSCVSNICIQWSKNHKILTRVISRISDCPISKFEKDRTATLEFLNEVEKKAKLQSQNDPRALPEMVRRVIHERLTEDISLDRSVIQTIRAVTASYARTHASDVHAGFAGMTLNEYIPKNYHISGGQSLNDFCCTTIEKMGVEAEDILLLLTAEALGLSFRVEIFSGGSQDYYAKETDAYEPLGNILFRPGHYDVLYRREHCSVNVEGSPFAYFLRPIHDYFLRPIHDGFQELECCGERKNKDNMQKKKRFMVHSP